MTEGAVAISLRSNSRLSRSWMISRCSSPRKPQRKPKPSAAEVSVSYWKLASLGRGLARVARGCCDGGGIDREQAAEHHRHARLEAGQRLEGRLAVVRDGIADLAVGDAFDRRR